MSSLAEQLEELDAMSRKGIDSIVDLQNKLNAPKRSSYKVWKALDLGLVVALSTQGMLWPAVAYTAMSVGLDACWFGVRAACKALLGGNRDDATHIWHNEDVQARMVIIMAGVVAVGIYAVGLRLVWLGVVIALLAGAV